MSFPATDNPAEVLAALNNCLLNAHAQVAAMESLRETGDRIFAGICGGDTGSLNQLLEARSAACLRISKLGSSATAAPGNLDQLATSPNPNISNTAAEILRANRQIDTLRTQILNNQQQCEEALRAAIADTSRQLRAAAGNRKVRTMYGPAVAATPRFLDSRK